MKEQNVKPCRICGSDELKISGGLIEFGMFSLREPKRLISCTKCKHFEPEENWNYRPNEACKPAPLVWMVRRDGGSLSVVGMLWFEVNEFAGNWRMYASAKDADLCVKFAKDEDAAKQAAYDWLCKHYEMIGGAHD